MMSRDNPKVHQSEGEGTGSAWQWNSIHDHLRISIYCGLLDYPRDCRKGESCQYLISPVSCGLSPL